MKALLLMFAFVGLVHAQPWPSKPIRVATERVRATPASVWSPG